MKTPKDHPAHKLRWAQKAVAGMKAKGSVGSMTRMAKAEGESNKQFASEHYNSPGIAGKKARFAANINGWRH